MSALHGICQPSFGGGSAPTRSAGEILILTNSEKGKSFLLSESNSRTYEWVCSPAAKCYKISVHSRDRGIALPPGSSARSTGPMVGQRMGDNFIVAEWW